jgi:hypothetical protein
MIRRPRDVSASVLDRLGRRGVPSRPSSCCAIGTAFRRVRRIGQTTVDRSAALRD